MKEQEIIEFCEYMQKNFQNPCFKCEIQNICIKNDPYKFPYESINYWNKKDIDNAYKIINKSMLKIGEMIFEIC